MFLFSVALSCAQKYELGTWSILNLKYQQNEKWNFFGEEQLRSLKFYNNFHYYQYKGGLTYKFTKSLNLTIGA